MNKAERTAWIAIPIVLLLAAGVAWAGSQGSVAVAGLPLFALAVALAFLIQWIVFVPSFLRHTEKFFDLTGSLTYLTVMALAVLLSPERDARSILLWIMVSLWAVRLGYFLFTRIQRDGHDGRFDELKVSFPRFLMTWTLQGLWVSLTLAAALVAITAQTRQGLGLVEAIGILVWLVGFGIEAVADDQKRRWRANKRNKGKFIDTGLWAWSRHPNYFGEILLWVGVLIIAVPVLQGWQWIALISPIFVTLLLTRVSGVPMLEKRADDKWGGQPKYEAYKAKTPVLIMRPPTKK